MSTTGARRSGGPRRVLRNTPRVTYLRFPTAIALVELGIAFIISALVDLTDEGDVTFAFLVTGVIVGAVGAIELRRIEPPVVTSPPAVMTMAALSWVVLALGATVAHLVADATNNLDTAIFEGTAAVTTTAMTGLDVDALPDGLILFRALLQWVGGIGGLIVVFVMVPLVMGDQELRGHPRLVQGSRPLISGRTRGLSTVGSIYLGFTAVLGAAYAIAGLDVFDSVVHAMGTASTGGLSSRTGSVGAFDDSAVEWVAIVGMAVAGMNLGLIWCILRGKWRPAVESAELRLYGSVLLAATAVVAFWVSSDDSAMESLRTSAFAVTSSMSTTGYTTSPWWLFDAGSQALLLVLMGIGAMSGTAGGGFRYVRIIEAFGFARRELTRQLHPTAVGVVRVNGRAVNERTLERLNGYMILFILAAAIGAMLVDLGDSSLTVRNAITLSVSALSTTGAQLVDPVDLSTIGWLSKLALSALMLIGRLSIYGLVLAVITVSSRVGEAVDAHRPRRAGTP